MNIIIIIYFSNPWESHHIASQKCLLNNIFASLHIHVKLGVKYVNCMVEKLQKDLWYFNSHHVVLSITVNNCLINYRNVP